MVMESISTYSLEFVCGYIFLILGYHLLVKNLRSSMNLNTRIVLTRQEIIFEYTRVVLTCLDQNMGRVLEYDQNIVIRGTSLVLSLDSSSNRASGFGISCLRLFNVLWANCTVGNTKATCTIGNKKRIQNNSSESSKKRARHMPGAGYL